MKLNSKGTKVVIENKYKLLGFSGLAIQFGLPFWYVAHSFDLFTFKNERYALTGWGMVLLVGFVVAFQKKIKKFIDDYNESLSATAKRAKYGHIFLTILSILFVSSIFINGFLYFFGVLTLSNYLSLVPYSVYDKQMDERKKMQQLLDKEVQEGKLSELKLLKQNLKKDGVAV